MNSGQQAGLVEGRTCGECTVCCVVPPITSPEFSKLPNIECPHRTLGKGCAIYDSRPLACRSFYCGWRKAARLDESWRPDRLGILLMEEYEDIPEGYDIRPALRFVVLKDMEVLRQHSVAQKIGELVGANVPVFLSIPGPPGCHAAKLFLNRALADAVKNRQLNHVIAVLEQGYEKLLSFPFSPVKDGPPN